VTDIATRRTTSHTQAVLVTSLIVALVCATNILVISDTYVPWIGAAAGFFFAVCLPAWMLSQKIAWRTDKPSERLCLSVIAAVLALMLLGLAINTVLPELGIARPLDRIPVLATIDVWCIALALWRPREFTPTLPSLAFNRLKSADLAIGVMSALCVPAAAIGAVRLNNGAGDGVTVAMLIVVTLLFIWMLVKREHLHPGTITAAIYFISLAMLLMTSLRGWYVTGHDIQSEYGVFELTKTNGDWNIGRFQDGYNACMSITILPTVLWQVIRVDDPYIYKFFFQLLFALCPVLVYRISQRHTGTAPAIIATIYFLAFPTYFGDMPFLNRQEIAFLFVAACVLVATDPATLPRDNRFIFGTFSLGVIISHYSTAYVFLGTVAIGWCCYKLWYVTVKFRTAARERNAAREPRRPRNQFNPRRMSPAISLLNVIVVLGGIFLWYGVATHTVSGLSQTITQAVDSLRGGTGTKASDVAYSLFSSATPSLSQDLAQYNTSTLAETSAYRQAGDYYPESLIKQYPIKLTEDPNLPITGLGHVVDDTGLNVAGLNSAIRAWAAKLLQILVAIGLIKAILSRRGRTRSFVELIALGAGALVIVVLQVVLPVISVNYGVERAFLQALIVVSPFVAIGSSVIFGWLGRLGEKWVLCASSFIALVFYLSLSGVLPQVLGGYPAQLHLDNSGQYYDLYYLHPQEISAMGWLESRLPSSVAANVQSEVVTARYTFKSFSQFTGVNVNNDIYPTLLRKNSYVFLGYSTVSGGQVSLYYNGDLITYQYPKDLLNSQKDLIYSSNGAEIYR
jgi:uncharacterized membrane protein